jgi:hypothetical protein
MVSIWASYSPGAACRRAILPSMPKRTWDKKMFHSLHRIKKTRPSHPFEFHLARLSLVNITLLLRNHMKIFILSGIFNFHCTYVENRVTIHKVHEHRFNTKYFRGSNFPHKCIQTIRKLTVINLGHKFNQSFHLFLVNNLLKPMFSGVWDNTFPTSRFFVYLIIVQ